MDSAARAKWLIGCSVSPQNWSPWTCATLSLSSQMFWQYCGYKIRTIFAVYARARNSAPRIERGRGEEAAATAMVWWVCAHGWLSKRVTIEINWFGLGQSIGRIAGLMRLEPTRACRYVRAHIYLNAHMRMYIYGILFWPFKRVNNDCISLMDFWYFVSNDFHDDEWFLFRGELDCSVGYLLCGTDYSVYTDIHIYKRTIFHGKNQSRVSALTN